MSGITYIVCMTEKCASWFSCGAHYAKGSKKVLKKNKKSKDVLCGNFKPILKEAKK